MRGLYLFLQVPIVIYFTNKYIFSFLYAQTLLFFFLSICTFVFGRFINKKIASTITGSINILFRAYPNLIFRSLTFFFFLYTLINLFEHIKLSKTIITFINHYFILFALIILGVILLSFLFEFLYGLTFTPNEIGSSKTKSKVMIEGLVILISLVFPDLIFGFLYNIFFTSLEHINTKMSIFDYMYMSFVIHFALPIHGEAKFYHLIKYINNNTILNILQIVHINSSKLIDLTIIASVIKNFFENSSKKE